MVSAKSFGEFRRYLGRESLRPVPAGSKVLDLLDTFPLAFTATVLASSGNLKEDVKLLVNGGNIDSCEGLNTAISDGDENPHLHGYSGSLIC